MLNVTRSGVFSAPAFVRHLSASAVVSSKKVAVVLSGCGVYDGSEVHEAAACMAAIARHNAEPVVFAPKMEQAHVINHQIGEPMDQVRCVLTESARIARTAVLPLEQLVPGTFSGIVFPGGFGAAKNLSDFGFKGSDMKVHKEVERVLKDFHLAGVPIALCCISPILAAKVFGSSGVEITLGRKGDEKQWPYGGALDAARSFGAKVVEKNVDEVCVDTKNRIVTTPAFMFNGKFHQIQDGVNSMIKEMFKLI